MDLEALKKTYQTLQKKAETENTSTFDFTGNRLTSFLSFSSYRFVF